MRGCTAAMPASSRGRCVGCKTLSHGPWQSILRLLRRGARARLDRFRLIVSLGIRSAFINAAKKRPSGDGGGGTRQSRCVTKVSHFCMSCPRLNLQITHFTQVHRSGLVNGINRPEPVHKLHALSVAQLRLATRFPGVPQISSARRGERRRDVPRVLKRN